MAGTKEIAGELKEGRRERKRRQTRERIEQAAMALFLDRGFDGTTIEDITDAADVSKRSFFDYFPSKEEVVFAWQDSFADSLAAAVAERPVDEPVVKVVEAALTSAVMAALDPQSLALHDLIRETPVLSARHQLKYTKLEQKLSEALLARTGGNDAEQLRIRLLSAVVVGALRVGGERWHEQQHTGSMEAFAREIFKELWGVLAAFGTNAQSLQRK
jgi:AcrR family transcriptional regulator